MTPTLFDRILDAHRGIRPQVDVTPLQRSAALSAATGADVWLKCEHHHPTGSFKLRGATNKMRLLVAAGDAARATGVVTASTGNHGVATALAGRRAGVPVTVYVPATAAGPKVEAIRGQGATLVVVDGPPIAAELRARRDADASGRPYISPYNDLDVMAGQGTLGIELAEQAPDLDAVFVAVGGGGLVGGTGTALKQRSPATRIVGVWPVASPCMLRAIEAGRIVDVAEEPTLSDGTAGAVEDGAVTFPVCRQVIDDTALVTETEIGAAMRRLAEAEHWMVEGAAGVALAGLLQRPGAWRGRKVAVVLCGRNIALDRFLAAIGSS